MASAAKQPGFDSILQELEGIVSKMESGELDLESSISLFERGVALTREGEKVLAAAQLKVDQLLSDGQESPLPTEDV